MTTQYKGLITRGDGLIPAEITVENGLIDEIVEGDPDIPARIIGPGLIDVQVNGGWGHDFTSDPASIWEVGSRLPETGVTSFLPTLITAGYELYSKAIEIALSGPPQGYRGARMAGLHFEGPWLSKSFHGAHPVSLLTNPDQKVARTWAESGVVSMVTLAPELQGADEVAEILASAGVTVSAGHTAASFDVASAALAGSFTAVTHLFNQMTGFDHRSPGMVGGSLVSNRPCGLIVDGLHSDPGAVRLAWEILGPSRTMLITDSMQALGLAPGRYVLGKTEVQIESAGPRTTDGRLAGSTLTMIEAVQNLVNWSDASAAEALGSATHVPADTIGLTDRGRIEPGLLADFVILDDSLQLLGTVVGGEVVHGLAP